MQGGMVHSDAMLVQVDVIFNPRVEPSIYERPKDEDLLIKQGACPFKGHAHSRVIVVARHAICHSSIMITYQITITYYDTVNGTGDAQDLYSSRPSDQGRNHRKANFGEMSSMRCFDHTSRSYDHSEI